MAMRACRPRCPKPARSGLARRWLLVCSVVASLVVASLAAGVFFVRPIPQPEIYGPATNTRVESLIDSEELLLRLTPELKKLARSVLNLQLPDVHSAALFERRLDVVNLAPGQPDPANATPLWRSTKLSDWRISTTHQQRDREAANLWQPLFETVAYFEHAKFYFVKGHFVDAKHEHWEAEMGFRGLARQGDDAWRVVKAKQIVRWKGTPSLVPDRETKWTIESWQQVNLTSFDSSRRLFAEVLDQALPDDVQRARARRSIHEELIVQYATDEDFKPPHDHFFFHAHDRHPGIAVVDIDRDGFDDLYVMARLGRNQLLRNRGNGTFEEIAADVGLDIEDHCSSAIFADFDNDGDPDLMLGRTLAPSMYFVNDEGQFVDRTAELVATPLPALVASISAADYNGDGLLDVYLSTYAAHMVEREMANASSEEPNERLLSEFLSEDESRELFRRSSDNHEYMARVGPPNVLLVNRGGGAFELSPASEQLAAWRNTYQATWGDYDGDGHIDLYLAHDFATNHLFRGLDDGQFEDVTEATKTADIGFGMGVAWGDYDNDGRQDLYISNMFSKAGRRITGQLDKMVDPRFAQMARGNSLLRNTEDGFRRVSGLDPPDLQVEMAGWSWGGQFLDVENDGYLDIYALSGYYSAPPQIAIQLDL